eukprot:TRINITY_DN16638_c0_g1::TRINITY_DN16638_c0_g1_i1::g.23633::m.23633 TRINITY_DN16638_c0_g1::TRINITY_DN16638_c0_g1_i1::g.23633  ORF type:complete len:105 (-),score=2.15 TRINITY_DN16638_c0_g1_i1:3-317(-)
MEMIDDTHESDSLVFGDNLSDGEDNIHAQDSRDDLNDSSHSPVRNTADTDSDSDGSDSNLNQRDGGLTTDDESSSSQPRPKSFSKQRTSHNNHIPHRTSPCTLR